MEFKLVYNEMRTDLDVPSERNEADLRENFVRVEVYNAEGCYIPSLIKVTHSYNQIEDWTTRWIFSSPMREQAIRHAIRILDGYKLGQKCSDMVGWNDPGVYEMNFKGGEL